ncbi:MAG: hypothetical protein PHC70_00410 [Patescibacteria group bacterium]|nr:hypothetical protein [Patescibacteria group bacterium]
MKRFKLKSTLKSVLILAGIGIAVGLAIFALVILIPRLFRKPSLQAGGKFVVPAASWHPEIATNEYWDYGTLNNLKLYVNNTDRNVIYALNPETGKIVWSIWGKDYGIDGYEIRMKDDHLFLSSGTGDKDYTGLWVFDKNGRFAWNHAFLGYLDMPQMLSIPDGKVVLESSSDTSSCLKGCGVLCEGTKPPEAWCTTHETWAFELATGKVAWVNRTGTYFGWALSLNDDGNIDSSGGGWGGFVQNYTLSSKTGEVISHKAILYNASAGGGSGLQYNQEDQTVSFINGTNSYIHDTKWQVKSGSKLYKLISEHVDDGNLRLTALANNLLIDEKLSDGSNLTHAFDAKDGKFLWTVDLDSKHFSFYKAIEYDDSLIVHLLYKSECIDICDTCPKNSWICVDTEPSKECKACQERQLAKPDFITMQIIKINRQNGTIDWKWHYGKEWIYINSIVPNKDETIVSVGDGEPYEYRILDLVTGTDRPAKPEDMPSPAGPLD